MKKLLIIAYYFPPINSSGVHRTIGFIKYLPRKLWDISVLTVAFNTHDELDKKSPYTINNVIKIYRAKCFDYFYFWKKLKLSRKNINNRNSNSNLTNKKIKLNLLKSIGEIISSLFKVPDNQSGWLLPALWKCISIEKPDIIYCTAPPFTGLVVAFFLKKIWKIPLVIDFRDQWTENPFNMDHNRLTSLINGKLEKLIMQCCDSIIANTEQMAIHFKNKFPNESKKISVITNGYDPDEYLHIKMKRDVEKEALLVIHTGLIYEQRNPLPFLSAIKNLLNSNFFDNKIIIQLIGTSELFEGVSLEDLIRQVGLADIVNTIPPVSHIEALERAKGADILLLFSQGTKLQIPAKLYEYLALGRPILAICEEGSATQNLLLSNKLHQIALNNHIENIEPAVRNLYINWINKKENFDEVESIPSHLSYEYLSLKFHSILIDLLKSS